MAQSRLPLGAKLRGLRRREGLSQVQLAEALGISTSYLNLIEHKSGRSRRLCSSSWRRPTSWISTPSRRTRMPR